MKLLLRYLSLADLAAVATLDRACYPPALAWTEEEVARLFDGHHRGMAAFQGERLLGYVVLHTTRSPRRAWSLVAAAVDAEYRRRQIGTGLFRHACSVDAGSHPVRKITAMVPENNLTAQLWLRALGFKADRILRDAFGIDGRPGASVAALQAGYHFSLEIGA
jgi:ribosomal protein S18 acetylase RimI-like enzyme